MTIESTSALPELPPKLVEELRRTLIGLRYGSIELVIHEGAIVQIERRERVRINLRESGDLKHP